jgi:hypothetical protein
MPSLMECVVGEIEDAASDVNDPEELLAHFDLDAMAISEVPGAWEPVEVADRKEPYVEGLIADDFDDDGPAVKEVEGYIIVRGREEAHSIYFVYERSV